MKKTVKSLLALELSILLSAFFSFSFFINLQVAFLSSFFIIVGSMHAYKNMIKTKIQNEEIEEQRDELDRVLDPYELDDNAPISEKPIDELDLKAIVKEEKKKIKLLNLSDIKKGSSASFSAYRLVPYLFLIIAFIALKNNELLDIAVYLPSLFLGIVAGYVTMRES
ncbi:MAG: hypothetical protein PHX44_04610 [Sulfurimonas sp.]|uniref:hypothetical protein n=1 Tax=Sulfurimonas sp. TaxID=2022749 RepID=UPI00262556F5|nr:hypothetical protein [Sulfurimonas sp.]MDD2652315.1 hypothetical protein [Sulfurimonas sp.]MDD3451516.1 hypothetical protein [Sulfurimonas sp.]